MKCIRLTTTLFLWIIVQQLTAQNVITHSYSEGDWKFSSFPGNIIKATFQPGNYPHNEQISNAVIVKPSAIISPGKNVMINSNGSVDFLLNQRTISLLNYFDSGSLKGFHFKLLEDEKIFGTGERSVNMDRRGYKLNLNNNPWYAYGVNADNLNYSVPFIISSKGYGIFFDNPSRGYVDIGKTNHNVLEYAASSGDLTFYLIPGSTMDEILRKFQGLIGTQPIPARWVFGNLMSRFGYRSEDQLMSIVNKMKQENFPVDAVILDLFWFGDSIKGTLGNLDWVNKKAWPDPGKMIAGLKRQGINTILITEPYVLNTTPNYEPSKKYQAVDSAGKPFLLTNFYFGNGGLLDLFRKDAQEWFWNKYKPQIAKGVAGWWGDLGEPETHPSAMFHNLRDFGFKRLFKADEVHNIFGHYWDKMLFDRYAKEYPDVRLFNLNRSGYAGSSRYGVFPWSGDVGRNWGGLQAQLPVMLGMSMSGVPYIHADAGGFALGEGDPELYVRWIQFAVFTPVLRPHGTALGDLDPSVKNIPSEGALYDDPYKSIARKYIQLRYQLLPYNYTLAYQQARYGEPLVRPLFYLNNSDSNLFKAEDEFMWGANILVCPVLQKSLTQRKLYLPEGNWYHFFTDKKEKGYEWITEYVDLENIPVFVKEGSFIPTFNSDSAIQNTGDYTGKNITVKYYPSAKASRYVLFDDDGKTNNTLAKGKYDLLILEGKQSGKNIHIKLAEGKHPGMTRNIKLVLPAGYDIQSTKVNNRLYAQKDALNLTFNGKPLLIDILLK